MRPVYNSLTKINDQVYVNFCEIAAVYQKGEDTVVVLKSGEEVEVTDTLATNFVGSVKKAIEKANSKIQKTSLEFANRMNSRRNEYD